MHDPEVVAFEIRRPWPTRSSYSGSDTRRWSIGKYKGQPWWKPGSYSPFWMLAGRRYYWPSIITIWHVEPGGADSGTVCKQWADHKPRNRWRFHFWHWHVQVSPYQRMLRWAFTRCQLCGRRFPRGCPGTSTSWNGGGPTWHGQTGIYHDECMSLVTLRAREERNEATIRDLFAAYCLHANMAEMVALNRAAGPKSDWPFLRKRELARLMGYEMDKNTAVWEKRRADVS